MPTIFDKLRAALTAKAPTAADLEKAVADATTALERAERELEQLQAGSRKALEFDEAGRAAHRGKLEQAKITADDARLYIAALRERLAQARATEAEAVRLAAYRAADAQADAAAKAVRARYPALAAEMVDLIHQVAEADQAVRRANADLPDGAPPLDTSEGRVRDIPGKSREDLQPVDSERWAIRGENRLLHEGAIGRIESRIDERGRDYFVTRIGSSFVQVEKRWVREHSYREDVPRQYGARLASLQLPGLRAGDPALCGAPSMPNPAFYGGGGIQSRIEFISPSAAEESSAERAAA